MWSVAVSLCDTRMYILVGASLCVSLGVCAEKKPNQASRPWCLRGQLALRDSPLPSPGPSYQSPPCNFAISGSSQNQVLLMFCQVPS